MNTNYKRVTSLDEVQERTPTYLSIGVFDGVHRGHQELLRQMSAAARNAGARSAVMTFFPHPRAIIPGQKGPQYLTTLDDRVNLIAEQGIDLIIAQPFDEAMRRTRAADFVHRLCNNLDLTELWGGNFGLGYRREGDLSFLRQMGAELGFSVHQFEETIEHDGQPISSSRIRGTIREGDVEGATKLLGRPYRIHGTVIHGDGRGKAFGIPTANLAIWDETVVPASGVYATYAWLDSQRYAAATNVGVRPTVNGRSLIIEAHLLDFSSDLYGRDLSLDFEAWIRNEIKFPGVDSLVAQIQADIALVKKRLQPAHS